MNKNLDNMAISSELFDWLLNNLPKDSTILEFGSGSGTIELTKNWNVYSVEEDEKWINVAQKSHYIHAPIKNGWYDSDVVFSNIPNEYDLIIVDGPKGEKYRGGINKHWDKLKNNVSIIFDDTHRTVEFNHAIEVANMLNKKWKKFEGRQKSFIILLEKS